MEKVYLAAIGDDYEGSFALRFKASDDQEAILLAFCGGDREDLEDLKSWMSEEEYEFDDLMEWRGTSSDNGIFIAEVQWLYNVSEDRKVFGQLENFAEKEKSRKRRREKFLENLLH